MYARKPDQAVSDAATLLLRIGLVTAFVAVPLAMLVSMRAIFILTPIAGALILAAGLIVTPQLAYREIFVFLFSRVGLSALLLGFWALLSLLWTPFPAEAAPRLFKIFASFLLVLPVAAALPPRTKAANLYMLPLGVALTAVAAILAGVVASRAIDPETPIRATEAALLLVWPALAATALRNRLTLSAAMAVVVVAAAVATGVFAALAATLAGAAVFAAANFDARRTGRIVGLVGAASFVFAPVLPLLFGPLVGAHAAAPLLALKAWDGLIVQDGVRILTGHGFNFVATGFGRAYLPAAAPHSLLFEAWTDLGLIGALGGAALIYFCYEDASAQSSRLAPFWLGGLTFVTAMGVFGAATLQMWWITALALALAGFALATRGDYKTSRPIAPKLPASATNAA